MFLTIINSKQTQKKVHIDKINNCDEKIRTCNNRETPIYQNIVKTLFQ